MAACIEREAINRICFVDYFLVDGEVRTESVALMRDIEKLPAADVAPVVHGVWLTWEDMFPGETPKKKNNLGVFCSMCKGHADNMTNYCPNCGAKMDGGMSE